MTRATHPPVDYCASMGGTLDAVLGGLRGLLVVAADVEADAILGGIGRADSAPEPWRLTPICDRFDLILTGVGKANAAGAAARLLDPARHAAVLNVGIAGALPGGGLKPGDAVIADLSVFADEGVATPAGFSDLTAMGFPIGPDLGVGAPGSRELISAITPLCDAAGRIATVSTCSGTDPLACEVVSRTGAIAEAMEGAAVGIAVARVAALERAAIGFAEVRAISNTTGDRDRQIWDLGAALASLRRIVREL